MEFDGTGGLVSAVCGLGAAGKRRRDNCRITHLHCCAATADTGRGPQIAAFSGSQSAPPTNHQLGITLDSRFVLVIFSDSAKERIQFAERAVPTLLIENQSYEHSFGRQKRTPGHFSKGAPYGYPSFAVQTRSRAVQEAR